MEGLAFALGVATGTTAAFIICGVICDRMWAYEHKKLVARFKKEAIENGFAEYNSQTGEWRWKGGDVIRQ